MCASARCTYSVVTASSYSCSQPAARPKGRRVEEEDLGTFFFLLFLFLRAREVPLASASCRMSSSSPSMACMKAVVRTSGDPSVPPHSLLRPRLLQGRQPRPTELRHAFEVFRRHRKVLRAGGRGSLLALGVVPLVTLLPPGSLDADGRLGLPALPTTMRGDPHRVTTQLEPDPSLSPQAPFASSSGTFTAPHHRTLILNRTPCWGYANTSSRHRAEATQFDQDTQFGVVVGSLEFGVWSLEYL